MVDFPYGGFHIRPPPVERQSQDLIAFLMSELERLRGRVIYNLIIVGAQGVGKSRIASMLAHLLTSPPKSYGVYYHIDVSKLVNGNTVYDYIILDDISASLHAYEHSTELGRTVAKLVVLIRNVARYGYIVAAPRERDILKPLRTMSYRLYLYAGAEVRKNNCDLYAVYVDRVMRDIRTFCTSWEDIYKYGDERWRVLYEDRQQEREMYIERIKQTLRRF